MSRLRHRSLRTRRPLKLEPLEKRHLLAAFIVNTVEDIVDPDDGATSLREAIALANETEGPDEIRFDAAVFQGSKTIEVLQGELEITETLAIHGRGVDRLTIDAKGGSRVFNFSASTGDLTLSGMTITGGRTTEDNEGGGGIRFSSDGQLTLNASRVTGNATVGNDSPGGGVFAYAGSVTLTDSTISDNQTSGVRSYGGGICTGQRLLTLTNSNVIDNRTLGQQADGGGLSSFVGDFAITDSIISGNFTQLDFASGGGLYNRGGTVTITDSLIADNRTQGVGSIGGGIYAGGSLSLLRSEVHRNATSGEVSRGGGLFAGVAEVADTTISENVTYGFNAGGGGVFATSLTLTRSLISKNRTLGDSSEGGGVLTGTGDTTITSSRIVDNRTVGSFAGGGGIKAMNGVGVSRFRLVESTVSGNITQGPQSHGGGVHTIADADITRSSIDANRTLGDSSYGGGFYAFYGPVSVSHSSLSRNTASGQLARGGGVATGNMMSFTLAQSTVSGNQANGERAAGGGIHSSALELAISSSTITENTASVGGGGMYSGNVAPVIDNTIIAGNTAIAGPDLAFLDTPDVSVQPRHSLIGDNSGTPLQPSSTPDANGNLIGTNFLPINPRLGPLQNNGGLTKTHALLSDSPAINRGSNALNGTTTTDQRGTPFTRVFGTSADIGAYERQTLPASFFVVTTLADELDYSNNAVSLREAVQNANGSVGLNSITFAPSVLNGDLTTIALSMGELEVTESLSILWTAPKPLTIDADQQSRALNVTGGGDVDVTLEGLSVVNGRKTEDNELLDFFFETTHSGGGIRFDSTGTLTLINSSVSGNRVEGDNASGGGIFTLDGEITLINSTVSGNRASGENGIGGGIYSSTGAVTVTNSTLSGNRAEGPQGAGGGIAVDDALVTIVNSTITNNFATTAGGGIGIYTNGTDQPLIIRNSIVAANAAVTAPDFIAPEDDSATLEVRSSLIGSNADTTLAASATPDTNGNLVGAPNALIDPRLAPLAFNGAVTLTHALLADSPAIDAGDDALLPTSITFDQRRMPFARIAGESVDMGAFERQTLADSFFVVTTLTDELDYSNDDVSLREAIQSANGSAGSQTITFAPELFTAGPATITLQRGELAVADSLSIIGPGQEVLTIDGNQRSRLFNVSGGEPIDLALQGLTLTGGLTTGNNALVNQAFERTHNGGAVRFVSSGILTLTESTVTGNRTTGTGAAGGAIFATAGTVLLDASTLRDNRTAGFGARGGAVFVVSGVFEATDSVIADNRTTGDSAFGGGINTSTGSIDLLNSVVSGNQTSGSGSFGGGVSSSFGNIALVNSTISGNQTQGTVASGGGVYSYAGNVTITNSTISGNRASATGSSGGGIFVDDSLVTITNSTITGNRAGFFGGGLGIFANSRDKKLTIHNSIIAANTAPQNADFSSPQSPATNLEVRFSLIGDNRGTSLAPSATANANGNLIGSESQLLDPKLGPLANNGGPTFTHALLPDSPALDAGNGTLLPANFTTDQRGVVRTIDLPNRTNTTGGNGLDLGAVEMVGVSIANANASEDAGNIDFVITLSHPIPAGSTVTARFSTANVNGGAVAGVDYTAVNARDVTFTGGQSLTRTVSVPILDDALFEDDETFSATISEAVGAIITSATAAGTILNDDPPPRDFGDAPSTYPVTSAQDGARHVISDLFLGAGTSEDTDGQPSPGAEADDDDGVFFISTLFAAQAATLSSFRVIASQPGKLDGWIDFKGDGDWNDDGEKIFNSVDVIVGENILSFTIPAGATIGSTAARFRLSTDGGLAPTGLANDGEVEDYLASLRAPSQDASLELELPAGASTIVVDGTNLVVRRGDRTVVELPFAAFGSMTLNGTDLNDTLTLTILEALANQSLVFDGSLGQDLLRLAESGQTLDLTTNQITLRNVETIDITGTGDNRLVVSVEAVKDVTPDSNTLHVKHNLGDVITFGPGWTAQKPQFIDGIFTHIITEAVTGGTARVEAVNERVYQNPLNRFDADRNGTILPLDALRIINELRRRGAGPITAPTNDNEISNLYFDVSGDNIFSALDALRIINELSRIRRGGQSQGEGEVLSPPQPHSTAPHANQLVSELTVPFSADRPKSSAAPWFDQPTTLSAEVIDLLLSQEGKLEAEGDGSGDDLDFELGWLGLSTDMLKVR